MVESTEHGWSRCVELLAALDAALGSIATLRAELDAARAETAVLRQKVADLEAKLAAALKNSGNSSKPPSSDITKPPKTKGKKGEKGKRKIGGQPGHPRHTRPPFEMSAIDHFIETGRLNECPCCQGKLVDGQPSDRKVFQQVELPEGKQFEVTQHTAQAQWCETCQKTLHAPWPKELVAAGLVGPKLTALIGFLKGPCHMSISNIKKYLRDVVGFRLSRGQIAKLVAKVSLSLRDPFEQLAAMLEKESVLNVDETGHKQNGSRLWTWCFRAALFTVYKISPSRGCKVLVETLGKEFNGLLGCDYFSAYRKYMRLNANVQIQFCMAHLIRDVKFLAEHPDEENKAHGQRLLAHLRKLFSIIHRRADYPTEEKFRKALEKVRMELVFAATFGVPETREASNVAERFFKHTAEYFRFISEPVEPTNNSAEQMIRFIAIHRRITQGTRGDTGQRWVERMATAFATCEQQGRSFFLFVVEAIKNLFAGLDAPSLLSGLTDKVAECLSSPPEPAVVGTS
ncbi:MAG: IS66 family transposase [Planctomycetota bacterium]|nr:IS66 family transposase [Planctomycetota bacterium]